MIRPRWLMAALLGAALAACAVPPGPPPEDGFRDPSADGPDSEGRCWASEPVPAIYEQVPGVIQVVQAEIAPDGTVLRPPIYRRAPVPRVVRPRGEIRFEVPCPDVLTPAFIASVQRALAARRFYAGAPTGRFDRPTNAAIRRYQAERGLDSERLSIETARSLGLIAVPRSELQ